MRARSPGNVSERGAPERRALDAQVLAWMREPDPRPDESRFEELALGLFRHQYECCPAYQRFCDGRGRSPGSVSSWREVPAVPTGAFKEVELRSFPRERERHVFRTSGTSGQRRGELHLDTLDLYEASLLPTFERFVLPDLAPETRARLLALAPSPEETPDSSLSHMFGVLMNRRGDEESAYFVREGRLALEPLLASLERACRDDAALVLCGTAFAFVHLLDSLAPRHGRLELPASTRVMETGGFKGRAQERGRDQLYDEIRKHLGLPAERVVNQYGMTELGSQFYDSVLTRRPEPRRKLGPPWARVRLLDPETADDCPEGEPGMIQIHDLANTGSIAAILTADLGRSVGDGFEVLGRRPGAEARGCSIAADEMLGSEAGARRGVHTDRSSAAEGDRSSGTEE